MFCEARGAGVCKDFRSHRHVNRFDLCKSAFGVRADFLASYDARKSVGCALARAEDVASDRARRRSFRKRNSMLMVQAMNLLFGFG